MNPMLNPQQMPGAGGGGMGMNPMATGPQMPMAPPPPGAGPPGGAPPMGGAPGGDQQGMMRMMLAQLMAGAGGRPMGSQATPDRPYAGSPMY